MAQAAVGIRAGARARVRARPHRRAAAGRGWRRRDRHRRLRELTEEVLQEEEGEGAVKRYRDWQRLDRLDRPLVVLLGGTTGVGKSTVAAMLAGRLGITRVIATDVIVRCCGHSSRMSSCRRVHHSAFEAGGIEGFRPGRRVGTGIAAIIEREATRASRC